jgi:vancomycin permeability regulator SanA
MSNLPNLLLIPMIVFFGLLLERVRLTLRTRSSIRKVKDPSSYRTAIVFGAGLNKSLTPTKALRDRLDKTIQLADQGQFDRILLSGGQAKETTESVAMRDYLACQGISSELLLIDEEGISTYDTLKRAKTVFHIQQATLISQPFHLPRAIGIAQMLGMDVIGIAADTRKFKISSILWWHFRELFAWIWSLIKVRLYSGT